MFVQKFEGAFAVDGMGPDKPLDFGHVFQPQLRFVQKSHFRKFMRDFFIGRDAIKVRFL